MNLLIQGTYSITGDGNYLQDSYVTGDGITMNHITTGYLTSVYTSHDIGILDFEFDDIKIEPSLDLPKNTLKEGVDVVIRIKNSK